MNREMILRVADAIEAAAKPEAKPEIGFNMGSFYSDDAYEEDRTGHACGTTACIAGWAMSLEGVPLKSIEVMPFETAVRLGAEVLGIDDLEIAGELFSTSDPRLDLDRITPSQAVSVLRHLAGTGDVDWSIAERGVVA